MKKKKLCEECGKKPATAKLSIGAVKVSVNGKESIAGRSKLELCDDCTVTSMNQIADWLKAAG